MRIVVRLLISTGLVLALSGFMLVEKMFAPKADLWAFWQTHDVTSTRIVDHAAWSGFLPRYLAKAEDGTATLAYRRVSRTDRDTLAAYITRLSGIPVRSLNRPEQLAYWINLYNAQTVLLIVDHYPVKSITEIKLSGGFFSGGPWGEALLKIEGQDVSLNDIEHRILRPIWQDARLHYALNCASMGCPDLQGEAFSAASMERLLDRGARSYINHPRGVEATSRGLVLSKIYAWFAEDFGSDYRALLTHLSRYAGPDLKAVLETTPAIDSYRYDWNLNEAGGT